MAGRGKPGPAKGSPRRGGRAPGTPNKNTLAHRAKLEDRMAALGCDPLELSARVAMGQELAGPHPQTANLRRHIGVLRQGLEDAIIPEEMRAAVESIHLIVENHIAVDHVPIELRSKHIVDLMKYLFPQRKAVDVTADITDTRSPTIDASRLSDTALRELLAARASEVIEGEVMDDDE